MAQQVQFQTMPYGEAKHQEVGVLENNSAQQNTTSQQYWLVFIHGGAWREDNDGVNGFLPSVQKILKSKDVPQSSIRGFASIDYRLSPCNEQDQQKGKKQCPEGSIVDHPAHILDVRAGLNELQQKLKMDSNYILMGHSAGATLAFQVLMGKDVLNGQDSPDVPLPAAIVGMAGIYDFPQLLNDFTRPFYNLFVTDAYGADKKVQDQVSPSKFTGNYKQAWPGDNLVMLAQSPTDGIVNFAQRDNMQAKLEQDGFTVSLQELEGDHHKVWREGSQTAQLTAQILGQLSGEPAKTKAGEARGRRAAKSSRATQRQKKQRQ
ncbi:hypothetical protein CDD82_3355 [Ophiocordyceps australis]|uniref:Kynurenine formamidase n=1 Tax=Ophiocordyceps australis TaxID=1399860 RepID=A0A2C5YIA2_9HYPO|nr:hypothetical protein CDD82_3355 [Ophiocordyceps australis]